MRKKVTNKYLNIINRELMNPAVMLAKNAEWRKPVKMAKKIIRHFHQDSLYRNSIYLMLSTFIMAFFGFFFWIICARLFSPDKIGVATALISITNFAVIFSPLGFNMSLIRYLPKFKLLKQRNDFINTLFVITFIVSLLIACFYLYNLTLFSPKLAFIKHEVNLTIAFIAIIIVSALNSVTDSIFIAYRDTKYIFINNIFYNFVKLMMPLFLITLGALGIYFSISLAVFTSLILSIVILYNYFEYKPKITLNKNILNLTAKFSFKNYIVSIIGSLPFTLMPIILINKLDAKVAAFYYMPMMIMNLLYVIPQSTTKSLFAEGSAKQHDLSILIMKTLKSTFILIFPSIILTFILGRYILSAFGDNYSLAGITFLNLITLSTVFYSINTIGVAILNIKGKVNTIIFYSACNTITTLVLAYYLLPLELTGIGLAWVLSHVISSFIYLIIILKYVKAPGKSRHFFV